MMIPRRIGPLVLAGVVLGATGCARSSIAETPGLENAVAQAAPNAAPAERFTFPADKGGKAIGDLVQPPARLELPSDVPPGPRTLPPPRGVDRPGVPLAPTLAGLASPPSPRPPIVRPRALAEEAPLSAYRGHPGVPELRELETGARVAVVGRDPNLPAPLGLLGLPVFDRVPLDDPTMDSSVQAALAGPPAPRTDPVPFAPVNLPDPFANAQAVKVHVPLPELPIPVTGPIRTPPPVQPVPAK
jgi:hypothetical protein